MEIANALLALGGDAGNTVMKYEITASEIAVLRSIHGEDSVTEIQPLSTIKRGNRDEIARLHALYGNAMDGSQNSIVGQLFPGAAARVFLTIAELELPAEFFKAQTRTTAAVPVEEAVEPAAPAKKETAAQKKKRLADEALAAAEPAEDDDADDDGIKPMSDGVGNAFE